MMAPKLKTALREAMHQWVEDILDGKANDREILMTLAQLVAEHLSKEPDPARRGERIDEFLATVHTELIETAIQRALTTQPPVSPGLH